MVDTLVTAFQSALIVGWWLDFASIMPVKTARRMRVGSWLRNQRGSETGPFFRPYRQPIAWLYCP